VIIRDFYFAAWAIGQGHSYRIEGGALHLEVDAAQLRKLKADYACSHKSCFDRVRQLIKEIHKVKG
jgi:hypothetical protein